MSDDLEVIQRAKREIEGVGEGKKVFYFVENAQEKDSLISVFKRVFEDNWGVYAARIRISK